MAAPTPVPVPSLEERERALAAREEAVRAQECALVAREEAVRAQEGALGAREEAILAHELALEIRASELSVGEDRLLEYTADLVREQIRHAREVEFLDTARDTLRWGRRALDWRWRQLHNAEVAFAARVEAHDLGPTDPP